jgi:very-short-patch-repair endonuclease
MGVVRRTISRHAAPLRRSATDAEQALWLQLRGRRLGGHKFRRQWTLASYIVDFCCLEQRLIVEVDGGQHRPERDRRRTEALEQMGFRILRFWNHDVLTNMDGVLLNIADAIRGEEKEDLLPRQFGMNIAPRCSGRVGGTTGPKLPQAGEGE